MRLYFWAFPFGSGFTLQLRAALAGFPLQSLTQTISVALPIISARRVFSLASYLAQARRNDR